MSINPNPSYTETAEPKTTGSYAERVNFDVVYENLAKRGINLTEEEKKNLRTICIDELKTHDGGQLLGTSLGASGVNIVYMLVAFIQNLFNNSGGVSLSNIGTHLGQTTDRTFELDKLHQLDNATIGIYQRMRQAGGNLALAAELITGQKAMTAENRSNPIDMDNSIYRQIRNASINLPEGIGASLDPGAGINYSLAPSTPKNNSKTPLTGRS